MIQFRLLFFFMKARGLFKASSLSYFPESTLLFLSLLSFP